MRKYLWILILIIIISCFATLFIFYPGLLIKKDVVYQLEDGSNVSQSQLQTFQDEIISEYNKNYDRYPPDNKQLNYIFFLKFSSNSSIALTYYGEAFFDFQGENPQPSHNFYYIGENDTANVGGVVFSPYIRFAEINIVFPENSGIMENYGHSTNVNNLNYNLARQLATDYYNLDYAVYLEENARLSQNTNPNYEKLNESAQELIGIYQSGTELEKEQATEQYFHLAEDWGFSDDNANNLLNNLKSENEQKIIPYLSFYYFNLSIIDVIWAIFLLVIGFIFVKAAHFSKKLEYEGKIGSASHLSYVLDILLALVGFGGYIGYNISIRGEMGVYQIIILVITPIIGFVLTTKYEKPYKPKHKQRKRSKKH